MNTNAQMILESIQSKVMSRGSLWLSILKSLTIGTGIVLVGGFYLSDIDKQSTTNEVNLMSKMILIPKSMAEAIEQKDYVRYQQLEKEQRQLLTQSSLEIEPILQMLKSLQSSIYIIKSTDAQSHVLIDDIRELQEIAGSIKETLAILQYQVSELHDKKSEKIVAENQNYLKKMNDILGRLLNAPEAAQDIYFEELKKIDGIINHFEQNMNFLEEITVNKRAKEIMHQVRSINNDFHAFVKIQHDFIKNSGPYLRGLMARNNFNEELRFFENYLVEINANLLKMQPLSWMQINLDTDLLYDRQQNINQLLLVIGIYLSLVLFQRLIRGVGQQQIDESMRDLRQYINSQAQCRIRLEHTCHLFVQILNGIFVRRWNEYICEADNPSSTEIVIRAKESSTWCDELDRSCQQLKNTTTSQEACIKSYEILSSKCLQNIKELSTCSQSQQQVIGRFEDGLRRLHTEMDQVKSYRMKILQFVDELQVIAINSALNSHQFQNEETFAHRLQGLSVDITLVLKRINQFFMNTEQEIRAISNQIRIIDRSNNLEGERLAQLKATVENMYESSYQVMCKDSQLNRLVSEIDHYLAKFHQMTQRMLHADVAAS